MEGHRYVIVGSGRQGTAAAYDLARHGQASRIVLADARLEVAREAAARVNDLAGRAYEPATVDARPRFVEARALGAEVALSAVPYQSRHHGGGHRLGHQPVRPGREHRRGVVATRLDQAARGAGVSVVPDCGMGPGLINHMGVYVMELLDRAREVYLYDGGLPEDPADPADPWRYQLTFHVNGLTNEYDGEATFIREGRLVQVPTFTELEHVEFPPLGTLEAFVISGSMSTTPHTHLGASKATRTRCFATRATSRPSRPTSGWASFPSSRWRWTGSWSCPGTSTIACWSRRSRRRSSATSGDACRGRGREGRPRGPRERRPGDRYDAATGFTAMERLTGWHAAILMAMQAQGRIAPGAHRMEQAVSASEVMAELQRRGISHSVRWRDPQPLL